VTAAGAARVQLTNTERNDIMLRWALIFLVLAIVAGLLGFTGVAGQSMYIARILFVVFILLFLVGLIYSLVTGRRLPSP
jgi:uncharacterized membrane protein YtjA (UPF0391 family)